MDGMITKGVSYELLVVMACVTLLVSCSSYFFSTLECGGWLGGEVGPLGDIY